jgi:hypothetical protein
MPKPVRVTVTAAGAQRLYNTRALKAGDMADLDPASVDAAVILGYVTAPASWIPKYRSFGMMQAQQEEEPQKLGPRPRGRPRKQPEPETQPEPQVKSESPARPVEGRRPPSTREDKERAAAEAKEPDLKELTVSELREQAEKKGIELPTGYVRKDELVELVGGSDEDDKG